MFRGQFRLIYAICPELLNCGKCMLQELLQIVVLCLQEPGRVIKFKTFQQKKTNARTKSALHTWFATYFIPLYKNSSYLKGARAQKIGLKSTYLKI